MSDYVASESFGFNLEGKSQIVAAAALVSIPTYILRLRTLFRQQRSSNPPGPKPLPLIGNLLDMPRTQEWKTFLRWKEQYGQSQLTKTVRFSCRGAGRRYCLRQRRWTSYCHSQLIQTSQRFVV
jgi:hypothetical protein